MASDELSLYDIETGLAEVLSLRDLAETTEEIEQADAALLAYCRAEVAKVDGIANYARHCRAMQSEAQAEASRLADRAKAWEGRRKRLLGFVQRVMESVDKKRIEGRVNTLLLKANGGRQAVEIHEASLVPDDMKIWTGAISGKKWVELRTMAKNISELAEWFEGPGVVFIGSPDTSAIYGELHSGGYVGGCHLSERGQHVEIK